MQMHVCQERRGDQKRGREYGKNDGDASYKKAQKEIMWRYEAIRFQDSRTGVKLMKIQRGIRHKDEFRIRFGEARGERERYIDVLQNRSA